MTNQESPRPHLAPVSEGDRETYVAVSGLAVTALVFGLFSVVALIDPVAWLVPAVGIILGVFALLRIARHHDQLIGRKAALAGLFLSLCFGSIAVGHWMTYRSLLRREARQVASAWFDRIARGQPQLAHQLALDPDDRQPPDSDAWAAYRGSRKLHESLKKYLSEPLLGTLMALGEKATVRHYATEAIRGTRGKENVVMLYAVTFDKDGEKTSFLVRIIANREKAEIDDRVPWSVVGVEGGVHPKSPEELDADG